MMFDVFSVFDVMGGFYLYIVLGFFVYMFFQTVHKNRFFLNMKFEEFFLVNRDIIVVCMGGMMVVFNFKGLVPFVVPLSAHMEFFLLFALMMFFSIVISNFFFNVYEFFVHLVPYSCPLALATFLFLMEVVSLFIRPLTLALRLGANMTSGHMILGMVMGVVAVAPFVYMFEIFVCFIQAYMFMTLVGVYSSEHF